MKGRNDLQAYNLVAIFLYLIVPLSLFAELRSSALTLPKEEVNALVQIASKLNKKWNFSVDPCSGDEGWNEAFSDKNMKSTVICQCTNTCHVTNILLKGMNLTGVLPEEFSNLPLLQELDLTRNYLNGTIPIAWGSLPLVNLSLFGNRISGRIPEELGNISTLQMLTLESNQLEGPIPASLGNLSNLLYFRATGNNLSGELPESLGNLKNLQEFRIDANPISGKIPSFVGNWTQLTRLDIQGTLMEGPFPPSFSSLTSIKQLRVSGLRGGLGEFPSIQNMQNLERLVLRNLSISGQLPDFIANMESLKTLDLSFNNLTGPIPEQYSIMTRSINYMYLTNNNLTGSIPEWILGSNKNLDLSYNSFTQLPAPSSCQQGNVDLVSSYSSTYSKLIQPCLRRNFPCPGKAENSDLFINCGGGEMYVDGNKYEEDINAQGPAQFAISNSGKWAYSCTGDFVDNRDEKYIATNVSVLNMTNSGLYMNARLGPLSLRYYGLCLQKGVYNVKLHFAEVMFTNDRTYFSLGRRIFDVYIQGQKVLEDFNIAEKANGAGKETIEEFNVSVDGTLEIHFLWAGKGTHAIPHLSVYGPLISAISVTSTFKPKKGDGKLSVGAISGIVIASCIGLVLVIVLLAFCLRRKEPDDTDLRMFKLQSGHISFKQMKNATNNFDPANKIGEGGFGPVYKGVLSDGSVIAVKKLSSKSKQGNREFINEIGLISALEHPNLVKLYGCCIEGNQLFLIYEYMENNNLAIALFGKQSRLDWEKRCQIGLGIARGLAYLHEESRLKIVHRDIKATNILLDKDFNAKISDFGLAKLYEDDDTHISTRIAGTRGYIAPEYATRGHLTYKADVYSFGIVMLEIVSGTSNTNQELKGEELMYLLDRAIVLREQGNLLEIVDPSLGTNYSEEEALKMLNIALACTDPSPARRPSMSTVVSMLDGEAQMELPSLQRTETNSETFSMEIMTRNSQSEISMDAIPPWEDALVPTSTSSKGESSLISSTSRSTGHTE